jgi:hypothetical protein
MINVLRVHHTGQLGVPHLETKLQCPRKPRLIKKIKIVYGLVDNHWHKGTGVGVADTWQPIQEIQFVRNAEFGNL